MHEDTADDRNAEPLPDVREEGRPMDTPESRDRASDPEVELLAEIEAIVAAVTATSTRFVPQRKRFNRALADLGLLQLVGPDWVGLDDDTVTFHGLDHRRLDEIVRRLEDIAAALSEVATAPGRGQLEIPFEPSPTTPSAPVSEYHVEVK